MLLRSLVVALSVLWTANSQYFNNVAQQYVNQQPQVSQNYAQNQYQSWKRQYDASQAYQPQPNYQSQSQYQNQLLSQGGYQEQQRGYQQRMLLTNEAIQTLQQQGYQQKPQQQIYQPPLSTSFQQYPPPLVYQPPQNQGNYQQQYHPQRYPQNQAEYQQQYKSQRYQQNQGDYQQLIQPQQYQQNQGDYHQFTQPQQYQQNQGDYQQFTQPQQYQQNQGDYQQQYQPQRYQQNQGNYQQLSQQTLQGGSQAYQTQYGGYHKVTAHQGGHIGVSQVQKQSQIPQGYQNDKQQYTQQISKEQPQVYQQEIKQQLPHEQTSIAKPLVQTEANTEGIYTAEEIIVEGHNPSYIENIEKIIPTVGQKNKSKVTSQQSIVPDINTQFRAPVPEIAPATTRRPPPVPKQPIIGVTQIPFIPPFQRQSKPPLPITTSSLPPPPPLQHSVLSAMISSEGKKNPNEVFLGCCKNKQVAKSCERICNFDILNKKTLTGMFLGTDPCPQSYGVDLLTCAAQADDHTSCCRSRGVHMTTAGDKCLGFCNMKPGVTFQADVSMLPCWAVLNDIKFCFKEHISNS